MSYRSFTSATALMLAAGPLMAAGHAADKGYALANGGTTLVVMSNIATPTDVTTMALSDTLAAIAWRPVTGELMGFANGKIVTIDTETGALTDLDASFMEDATTADGAKVAFDFNNKIDAVRAVSTAEDNLVYFPGDFGDDKAGSVRRFADLAYAEGDVNAGADPVVFANAYTNAINSEKASGTFQYALEAGTDALISLANNKGTLETIAPMTVDGATADISDWGGFDIMSPAEGEDQAFAILQMEGAETAGFYTIDLATGAATMVADLGMGGFTSFAVARHR